MVFKPIKKQVRQTEDDEEEDEEDLPVAPSPRKLPAAITKEVTRVVKELPLQPVRQYTEEDGTVVNLITTEEYLTQLANGD